MEGYYVMFNVIKDLPSEVIGIEIHGKLTHEDYVGGLIPLFDKKLEQHKPMRVLFVIGSDFKGFELAAMWDDATYGLKHWSDISHIAVVCDQPSWIKSAMALFSPFFPGEVRNYDLLELDAAKKWLSDNKDQ